MEFQIAEAIELIKTLAETENLTKSQALTTFVAEAGLDLEEASILKAALFESYTLQEMATDSVYEAMYNVFVAGAQEDIQETDTKETQEGTKYKVRVKDRASGSSYVRYATREKIAELRANPNIASVELTDYGSTGEDDRGERTAAAKGGGRDRDGDGKVESSSKEHAGVVHNAIQRKMGGKPDGQDTRKEEVELEEMKHRDAKTGEVVDKPEIGKTYYPHGERKKSSVALRKEKEAAEKKVEEGIDFKAARREQDRRDKIQAEKDKKNPSGKDRRLMLRKFRPGASQEERAEGGRDSMREKGTSPKKDGKKMFEAYLELRAAKKAEVEEGWKPDPKEKREKKAKELARREEIASAQKGTKYETSKTEDPDKLYKRRIAVQFKQKMKNEEFVAEADLIDSGRENQAQREKKKLTGKGVDNSKNVKLMPKMDESVIVGEKPESDSQRRLTGNLHGLHDISELSQKIKDLVSEECCPNCGTPKCTCEDKKEEKPKKKKAKLDESGMPILEYSRNNATGPTKEMIDPERDAEGEAGVMNPKGEPKRPMAGDRRPNRKKDKSLPNEDGTVPNGSGV